MTSPLLTQFSPVPKSLLREGQVAPVDLHLYLPANQSILLFRKRGDTLGASEMKTIHQVQEGSLVVKKVDFEAYMMAGQAAYAKAITTDPASPGAQTAAKAMLQGLNVAAPAGGAETPIQLSLRTKKMIESAFNVVKDIVTDCQKKTPSAKSFLEVLSSIQNSEDPLQTHCRHVSALSTLCLITLGDATIEELTDIAYAGLIHDLGLTDLPEVLLEKHLNAVPVANLSTSERMALMRHVDVLYEQLKITKTFVSDGARRTLEHHHENWAGTGFKGLRGNKVYRSARVMHILDEFVTLVQNPKGPMPVAQALGVLKDMKDVENGEPLMDPQVLASLRQAVLGNA